MITRHEIFNKLDTDVNTESRPVYMASRFEPVPESFPACYVAEISRRDIQQYVNLGFTEYVKMVGWEAQVFSNKITGAVDEAHEIMCDVEASFKEMKFIETFCSETPFGDPSIYRIVARFERVIADADTIEQTQEEIDDGT